ncbi:MAG: ribonuclease III [Gammaproteobacteria bacterium]|nr:ribonuclease III [Gammaproteobacteria bacterium]
MKADELRQQQDCMKRIGHKFSNPALLWQALTHRSYASTHNERLEFLGDGILNFLAAEALYARFPKQPEGVLTRMRARLVREETLAEFATELELGDCLKLGSGELKSGGFRRASTIADAFEAVIAAIYLDAGMEATRFFVLRHLLPRFDTLEEVATEKDPKTRLQEWCQARGKALPNYELLKQTGDAHALIFTVACHVIGLTTTQATANSRRKAEQSAASLMLAECEE